MSNKPFANSNPTKPPNADSWVDGRNVVQGPQKRFTFNLPLDLHRRVKLACVERGADMAEVMRHLLEQEFPAPVAMAPIADHEIAGGPTSNES